MAKKLTLGKNERLKSRKQIELLFNEGKKLTIAPFRIFYVLNKQSIPPLQFGVGVSNKYFKKAVDRNKIKRVVRESYRLQKSELLQSLKEKKSQLNVFFIYNGKEVPSFADVDDSMKKALDKINRIIESEN